MFLNWNVTGIDHDIMSGKNIFDEPKWIWTFILTQNRPEIGHTSSPNQKDSVTVFISAVQADVDWPMNKFVVGLAALLTQYWAQSFKMWSICLLHINMNLWKIWFCVPCQLLYRVEFLFLRFFASGGDHNCWIYLFRTIEFLFANRIPWAYYTSGGSPDDNCF